MERKMIYLSVYVTIIGITSLAQDITYHIEEELSNSTKIGNIGDDSNLFSAIGGSDSSSLTFSFLTTGNQYSHYFRVGKNSADLFTNDVIDRETVCEFTEICMLVLQIAAKSELGSFFRILKIHVFINDINDHSPVFSKSTLTLPVSEAVLVGTSYAIDGARDRDTSPEYSLKQYELQSVDPDFTGNLPFSIQFSKHLDGSSIIRLYVTEPLNREVRDAYHLEITAFDGDIPPRQGRLPVFIIVSDANDNQPQFDSPSYNCTVTEETMEGEVIIQLNATDLDSEDNGKIKYKLSPHQSNEIFDKFGIIEDTGEIILKEKIVYSPGKIYRIIVEAYDNPIDGQSLSTQTFVIVNIENTGNNAPKIVMNLLTQNDNAEVPESANIGKVVAFVEVVDHDEGKQGMASCIIQSIDFDIQRIDMNKYKIFVAQPLDYERNQIQTVTVHCQDNGKPPLPASASFNISILDKNDNTPVFTESPYTKNVREDLPVRDFILQVSATDLDSGKNSKVSFEISKRYTHKNYFYFENLPNNIANLRLNRSLDRDTISSYVFPIYAIDEGEEGEPSKTGSAMINLHITDVNDEKPVFKMSPFTIVVLENLPADTPVGNVIATDNDLGVNAQVEYKIHPDDRDNIPFIMFSNGNIKTNQELDREAQDRYEFKVIATDKGENPLSSTGTVVVLVSDANDMYPEIRFPRPDNNTASVVQSAKPWQIVTRVLASDADEIGTGNSRLRFDIIARNDSELFQINPNTGEIQITKSVDSVEVGKLFKLDILVSDYGKPRAKTSPCVLFIRIKSSNATKTEVSTDVLSNQNFLIAIIVGIVTVVLSLGILATICIIRRIDRERKEEQKRKNNNQIKVDPDINDRQVFDGSITVFSLPSEDSLLNEKKKKEVSFSLEDDVFSDDDLIQKNGLDNNHRHFKPNLSYLTPSTKKVEDNHSETSGDTGTSDSGRGGSDEEIHTSMSQSPRDKMMDFTRPLPPISHQEIIPFSFKKGMALPYNNRDYSSRPDVINTDNIEMSRRDLDPHKHGLSTMAVHLPNDSLDRSRNKVVLLQTDSGIHSDTNSNEGDNTRDCMV
ncbi:putative protocadherin beta-18 [Mercenaria mercenaria]|uniref:putative protocadherin beta-18 n=1 Tax=Mercenaria mercenaria TaxID=6596 RepID=UPI00234EFFBE|nr:putative protocadherin beta-18 [Mercenaria mercenaria]